MSAGLTAYMLKLADEMHAASAYICEHGKIEIDTPQSRRLIDIVQMGEHFGITPTIPQDYPMEGLLGRKAAKKIDASVHVHARILLIPKKELRDGIISDPSRIAR